MEFKLYEMNSVIKVSKIANVHFFEFPKCYQTKPDKHAFCELLFISNGSLQVYSDDYNGELKKNDFIIHMTNRTHYLKCPENATTTVIIIGFECESEKLKYFAHQPIRLSEREINQLIEIVKEGRNVFSPPYNVPVYNMQKKKNQIFGCEQQLHNYLEAFLISLIRKYNFNLFQKDTQTYSFQVNELISYLNANYKEKITLDELAFLFKTNRTTLCREFKKATQYTPIDYIINLKIKEAQKLLTTTSQSISQISQELNFDTDSHFCAFFKKHTTHTPIDYRYKKTLGIIH